MAKNAFTRIDNDWYEINGIWTKIDADWIPIKTGWTRIDNVWHQWWPTDEEPPPSGPSPGTYILSPTSQSWPTTSQAGWALFNTAFYRGHISVVSARVSWSSLGSPSSNVDGRPSGTRYRTIAQDSGWANRTITHDLGATAVSQMNSGSATGYTITSLESFPGPIGYYVNAARLTIVVT